MKCQKMWTHSNMRFIGSKSKEEEEDDEEKKTDMRTMPVRSNHQFLMQTFYAIKCQQLLPS